MVERAGEVSWMSRQGQLRRNTTSALTQGPEGPDCGLMLCRRVLEICILFEQGSPPPSICIGPCSCVAGLECVSTGIPWWHFSLHIYKAGMLNDDQTMLTVMPALFRGPSWAALSTSLHLAQCLALNNVLHPLVSFGLNTQCLSIEQ